MRITVRGFRKGGGVALVVLVLAVGLTSISGVELGREPSAPGGGGPAPAWDTDRLRQCSDACLERYSADPVNFNRCYTCGCLLRSAENEREIISAAAQCEQALEEEEDDK